MEHVVDKWIVHKRLPEEGNGDRPWGVYTSQGLELHIFKTWREAMAVATVLTSMTTHTYLEYYVEPNVYGGNISDNFYSSAKLRIHHEHTRSSWVINKNVVRGNEEV